MKTNNIITILIVAVVVGAAAFYGGMQYEKKQSNTEMGKPVMMGSQGQPGNMRRSQNGNVMQGGPKMGSGNNAPVLGEIIAQDDKSITVKLPDGSSKIVMISDKTEIHKEATGTKAELQKGQTVAAFGTKNSDGSVTAQNIQLNPMMRFKGSR